MSDRSITVKISTSKAGFILSVKEQEAIVDEEGGGSHVETESSGQEFAMFRTAAEAAEQMLKRFEQRMKAPEGELFA